MAIKISQIDLRNSYVRSFNQNFILKKRPVILVLEDQFSIPCNKNQFTIILTVFSVNSPSWIKILNQNLKLASQRHWTMVRVHMCVNLVLKASRILCRCFVVRIWRKPPLSYFWICGTMVFISYQFKILYIMTSRSSYALKPPSKMLNKLFCTPWKFCGFYNDSDSQMGSCLTFTWNCVPSLCCYCYIGLRK